MKFDVKDSLTNFSEVTNKQTRAHFLSHSMRPNSFIQFKIILNLVKQPI